MSPLSKPDRDTSPRNAFSLVELLVVIAIIGILAGLAFAVLGQTGQSAREAATKSGILVIQRILDDRIRGFENITQQMALADPDQPMKPELREFRKRVLEFRTRYNAAYPMATLPAEPSPVAEIYVRKALFKAAFPQREEDLYGMDGVSDFENAPNTYLDDSPLLARMWNSASSSWSPDSWKAKDLTARAADPSNVTDDDRAESAELLYLVLTSGDVLGLPPSDLDGIDQNLIGDTDNDGNLELMDGWGKSLQFYNWPTRFFKANGVNYTATDYAQASILVSGIPNSTAPAAQVAMMNRDVEDNTSALTRMCTLQGIPFYFSSAFSLSGRPRQCQAFSAAWFHDRDCYSVPLIVSAGPDGSYGMELPNSTATAQSHLGLVSNSTDLADNISNRQKGPQ